MDLASAADVAKACRSAVINDVTYYIWNKKLRGVVSLVPLGGMLNTGARSAIRYQMRGQKFITIRPSSPMAHAAKTASLAAQKAMTARRKLKATESAQMHSVPDEEAVAILVRPAQVVRQMRLLDDLLHGLTEQEISEVRTALTAYLEGRLATTTWLKIVQALAST